MELEGGKIQPVALWTKNSITAEENVSCYVSGWGATSHGGSTSNHLMFVKVPLISYQACRKNYGQSKIKPQSMICAGYPGIGKKDACQGTTFIFMPI